MTKFCMLLLLLHVLTPCIAFFASPLIQINAKSSDISAALQQAAAVLNVPEPGNWAPYMNSPSTTGSTGTAQVGSSTLGGVMAGWSIPDQFRGQAVQNVNLLVLAATEGTYTAQAFLFDIQSGASLTTLLVVAKRLDSPSDPNSPVAVAYVTINTNAVIKQQYTPYNERSCHKCAKCAWLRKCCCHDETKYSPRGNTPEELHLIKQKMTADQFVWFNQQPLRTLVQRAVSNDIDSQREIGLVEVLGKFLSSNDVKAEVLASYNDSVLTALQSNITSLKLSSQSLKLTKIARKNLDNFLSALAKDYGFDDLSANPHFLQQLQSGRFSYENLFSTSTHNNSKETFIKYIWLLAQTVDNLTYSLNFLFVNITSQVLIDTLLHNGTNTSKPNDVVGATEQLKIVRTSTFSDRGEFLHERLSTLVTPWQLKTTKIALNILRFIAASTLVPQKYRMLSYFDPDIISPETEGNHIQRPESRDLAVTILGLAKAVSAAASAWKDVVSAIKSSSSTTIKRITRFGFTHFNQKSTVLKAIGIPADKATEFINAVIIDYNLPSKGSFMLGLTYSDDFAWDRIEYLYSPAMNGNYRSLTLFKNGDTLTNTASFFIVDINADWQLAPDLLLINKSKSILGGLWESSKDSIEEVPHVLTMDEAVKLQQFFMLVAMGNIASTLGLNVTVPSLE